MYNLIKIITAVITVIISITIGFNVLRLNPSNLLNRWFTIFFISSSVGFLIYTVYHLITDNSQIIIPLMVTGQIFFNFIFISLTMTVFVLEKYEKVAMSFRYFGTLMILFIIMSLGYFIWRPTLNMDRYALSIVDTDTPLPWFIFVYGLRIVLSIYVVSKYAVMTRKMEEETKRRVQWFFAGIIFAIFTLFINVIGGVLRNIIIEIIALITLDVGMLAILKGFLIK
ncbi:MAG: hypothetical protein JSV23_09165 [Promethearchaeota archaeon]|nr:MAG: hypothetical protein JSV23_09165 [Candidatus Lokiarchaeota archaeon]